MKHIEVKYHFIRQLIEDGIIRLLYINTKDMTADILTKTLAPSTHTYHTNGLGITSSTVEEECRNTTVKEVPTRSRPELSASRGTELGLEKDVGTIQWNVRPEV